jgi:plasmid stabilization system protein ParE
MTTKSLDIYKTPTAERRIKEIIRWSAEKWNKNVAEKYALELEKTIRLVAEGKISTKTNLEYSSRFSYCISKRHYIFFEIHKDKLIVATLFHVAMDIKNRIMEEEILK